MDYPLSLSFKVLGLAPQIYVRGAGGSDIFYVKQKLFKLKEAVQVFRDSSRSEHLYSIGADRIIDFSAKYTITDEASGSPIGAIKRQGMKSMFKAHYDVLDGDGGALMTIQEESVMKRILDRLVGEVPLIGFLLTMLINPTYLIEKDGEVVLKLHKKPAFFEGKFEIEQVGQLSDTDEKVALLSILMMTLLERTRG